jgi:hypothetical protein
MKRWRGTAIGFAALLMLAAAACGGRGTAVVGSGTPPPWAAVPGWLKVAASSGSLGDGSWAHSPYFYVDGERVRVVGSLTSDAPDRFRWEVRLVPRKSGVDDGALGVKMRKTANDPARSDPMYFEGISERPLAAGDYRVAIEGSPGSYSLVAYVHE